MGVLWSPQPRQYAALVCPADVLLFGGAAGGGKALALDTKIPTPWGWSTMADIKPGDVVIGGDGRPTEVLAATEAMEGRPCFLVTFDDGREVVADAEHLWPTTTREDREKMARRSPEFRESRRARRPKRGLGAKPWLASLNSEREYEYLPPPGPTNRTTYEIWNTLRHRGALNHAIGNCLPLALEEAPLPIDPYVLGIWLGDGSSYNGAITTADPEIVSELEARGYHVKKWSGKYEWGINGLKAQLRELGVLEDKHVPAIYLRSSFAQRLELVRGLIDTDGTVGKNGSVEFTSTLRHLSEQLCELVSSLGIKAVARDAPAKLRGVEVGRQYRVKFTTSLPVARLPRKAARLPAITRPSTGRRFIVSVTPVPSVPVKCIQVAASDGIYLVTEGFIPTHNSDFLLADALQHAESGGEFFRGVLFRRSYPELEEIISRSLELYSGRGEYHLSSKTWRFTAGGTLKLRYIESDQDVYAYQGHQYTWIGWDELGLYPTRFPFDYLKSRLRSPHGLPCRVRATANPGGPGHAWLKGYFIDGHRPNEIWADLKSGESVAFIPSRVEDNGILMRNDPAYVQRLESLPEHLRRALRDGDWNVFAGQVFSEYRDDLHVIRPTPLGAGWHRFAAMDWGYSRPFSIGYWAVNRDGRMVRYREWYGCKPGEANVGLKLSASQVAAESFALGAAEGCDQMVADPACWSKIDDSPSIADKFQAAGWRLEKADNDRLNGLARLHDLMTQRGEDGRPMLLVYEGCRDFRRTIPLLVADPRRPEDIDTSGEDHVYDEARYAALSPWARNPAMVRTRERILPATGRDESPDPLRIGLRK